MKKTAFLILSICMSALMLSACERYEPVALSSTEELATETAAEAVVESSEAIEESEPVETAPPEPEDTRERTVAKGIYLAYAPVNNESFMDEIISVMDETELNAVVIDVKDDYGRITYDMQGVPLVDEIGASSGAIEDLPGIIAELKAHDIYCIARVVALKDPFIAEAKPEWALYKGDGSIFRDNAGDAWVNPYKTEYWDYLLDVSRAAGEIGFDEIQFDYIRFCTERGVGDVVYDEADTLGRDKISIITELVNYLSENLREEGLFVSADVFGTIIGSSIDANSVGQSYTQMADALDYICPMIYPSHYASGNFGLEHPDLQPYECILGALGLSERELSNSYIEGTAQAIVRPWLQAFTASYLGSGNYMEYGADAIRAQIQAVYDAGYDEWILWDAAVSYDYGALLSEADAEAEAERIAESRAAAEALAAIEAESEAETFPEELQNALNGDELYESDAAVLSQDGPIITYEEEPSQN
ncbi:MAG TPA: putative glycoside hydrolase [Candidatus Avilachnospira avistercoris]|nr:putative glycoside hydrolase [Candidatus Avilachnospira avistercoris]